jgi:hypothetical protein
MSGWQPIKTAPVGFFLAYGHDEHGEEMIEIVAIRKGGEYSRTCEWDTRHPKQAFTHWMPLPEPPA